MLLYIVTLFIGILGGSEDEIDDEFPAEISQSNQLDEFDFYN